MIFCYMMIEPVPTVAHLSTILAGIGEGARKVNVFHVFPQIGAVRPNLAAHGATMRPGSGFRQPLNVTIQLSVGI